MMVDAQQGTLGIYISVPFCRSKCTYCNFASGVYGSGQHVRYAERICQDLRESGTLAEESGAVLPRIAGSVYLGGGTPSTLAPELLQRVFAGVREQFAVAPGAEVTVECAPGQIDDAFLEAMLRVGVNRVSLGVQSFVDREASATGRLHTRKTALADIRRLRDAGIAHVNADLIAGLPYQTGASWRESLEVLAASGVDHASLYTLEVDEDSRLGRELLGSGARYGAGLVPHDDAIAAMYETGCAFLEMQGLRQYEISNFACEGSESRHNRRYWQRELYLGLGLDAHSMLRTVSGGVVRWGMTDDLASYVVGSSERETTLVSRAAELEEAWFLGLRLNAGLNLAVLGAEFGAEAVAAFEKVVQELCSDGLLECEEDWIRLTTRGRMLSNDVFSAFLGLADGSAAQA